MKTVDVKVGDFTKKGVIAPDSWSDKAVGIAARMYMTADEYSVYDLVDRVVNTIVDHGNSEGYFSGSGEGYRALLRGILLNQEAAFNTPVWTNIGVPDRNQQAWACLILGVDDSMDSLEEGWIVESRTFQGGSGSGVNVSRIRANGEPLSDGCGVGSGPISLWMRPTDSIAGVVRSGGRTRRAAKMVIMDVDHPEIMPFIETKARAERMARDLQKLGYNISMTGDDSANIPFQNANNSVRVTDEFMMALDDNGEWDTTYRTTGEVAQSYQSTEIWRAIAQAAWECGDPGLQFHDTINAMNPVKADGEITASNPCSEYMFLNDTVCNLASINLMKFYDLNTGKFDVEKYKLVVKAMTIAMDILVDVSSYPTEKIGNTSKEYRTLGLGFTNLGALLMSAGLPYDSYEGRSVAASLQAILQASSIYQSQILAERLGAYPAYNRNKIFQKNVIAKHLRELDGILSRGHKLSFQLVHAARRAWDDVHDNPVRNAQFSVIAPTGTISFLMDAETTGIEPVLAVDATKHLVGGGTLNVGVQDCTLNAAIALGFDNVADALAAHPEVFQTALGDNVVSPEGHVLMMAAVQPFVSGAISKTVNLPSSATVEDVMDIYLKAWVLNLKAIAVFRDGCKAYQPVTADKKPEIVINLDTALLDQDISRIMQGLREGEVSITGTFNDAPSSPRKMRTWGERKRPEGTREGYTHKFEIQGHEYYITVNRYPDGQICEMFITNNKHGSAIGGWAQATALAVSLGLQYGVPMSAFVDKFSRMNFFPQGFVTTDSDIKMADSPVDYIFRWIDKQAPPAHVEPKVTEEYATGGVMPPPPKTQGTADGRPCWNCQSSDTVQAGTCLVCRACGETSGCS